jgi:outer membrane protein
MMNSTFLGAFASVLMQAVAPPTPAAAPVGAPTPSLPPAALSASPSPVAASQDNAVPAAPSTAALLAGAATQSRPVLPLEAAEHTAMDHQPNIRQARSATAAAIGRVQEARSGYLPQVIGTASWAYGSEATHGASTAAMTAAGTASTSNVASSYVAQLAASQLIYDFGQTTEKWKSADRSVESLQATETTTRNQIIYNVRSAFFTARADHALVRVEAETLGNEQRHLVQAEGFVRAGTQPEIALAQARTDVANAKVQLIQAENNYDVARAQLNMAMGVTTDVDYDVADKGLGVQDGEDDPSEPLVARALAARPELAGLVKLHEADVLTIRSLEGGYAPTLSGLAGAGLFGSDVTTLTPAWQIGLSLSWPILLGGLTHGQINEARGNLGVVDAQLEAERLQVRLDVEQARLGIRSAKVTIGATEEALINARDQLRLAEGRFAQGVGSIIELGDAQVAQTAAGAQRVQADFSLAIARAQLLLALGRP